MKIVCIDNSSLIVGYKTSLLTVGKTYEITVIDKTDDTHWTIIDDTGEERHYKKTRFETLQETRDGKLNNLGI